MTTDYDGKTCGGCWFWHHRATSAGVRLGQCRRFPPQANVSRNGDTIFSSLAYPATEEKFPACAEHVEGQSSLGRYERPLT